MEADEVQEQSYLTRTKNFLQQHGLLELLIMLSKPAYGNIGSLENTRTNDQQERLILKCRCLKCLISSSSYKVLSISITFKVQRSPTDSFFLNYT